MGKKLGLIVIGVSLIFASSVFANLKVGVINLEQITVNSQQVKMWQAKIKKDMQPQTTVLINMRKVLMQDVQAFRKLDAKHATARKILGKKIVADSKKFREMQAQLQSSLLAEKRKAILEISGQVKAAIDKVAVTQKLDMVIKRSAVVYYNKTIADADITAAVIKAL